MKIKLDTKKIYLEMAEKGLTATEIARQGGVSQQAVSNAVPSWKSPFTEHGKAKVQLSHILQTDFPTTP